MNIPHEWSRFTLWEHADRMVGTAVVVVDRPAGSCHPKVPEYRYPLDYGYLEGTVAGDGEGVDVWSGSGEAPKVTAIACTIDPVRRNAELKLLWRCTEEEIAEVEGFYDPQPQAVVIIRRPC